MQEAFARDSRRLDLIQVLLQRLQAAFLGYPLAQNVHGAMPAVRKINFMEDQPMAVTIRNIVLWRKEAENEPGALAATATLEPFAKGGADLQLVMGYRYPGQEQKARLNCIQSLERNSPKLHKQEA
jgi:hypothetical protein